MVMSGLVKTFEINEKEYYTYDAYTGRGIHGENLGPTKIIGAEYKLVTYFSLKEYNAKCFWSW